MTTLLDELKAITGTVDVQGKEYFEITEQDLEEFLQGKEPYLLTTIADIRSAMGNTEKLMLDELAPEITKRIAKLESEKARLVEALKAAQVSVNRLTSDESSTQEDFDNEDLISCLLAEMRGE
jgi:hypothetical protein